MVHLKKWFYIYIIEVQLSEFMAKFQVTYTKIIIQKHFSNNFEYWTALKT